MRRSPKKRLTCWVTPAQSWRSRRSCWLWRKKNWKNWKTMFRSTVRYFVHKAVCARMWLMHLSDLHVCDVWLLGSWGDKEGAFKEWTGKGSGGVQGKQAPVEESQPHDRSYRQDHHGAGEGQGDPGRTDRQWLQSTCWVRAKIRYIYKFKML